MSREAQKLTDSSVAAPSPPPKPPHPSTSSVTMGGPPLPPPRPDSLPKGNNDRSHPPAHQDASRRPPPTPSEQWLPEVLLDKTYVVLRGSLYGKLQIALTPHKEPLSSNLSSPIPNSSPHFLPPTHQSSPLLSLHTSPQPQPWLPTFSTSTPHSSPSALASSPTSSISTPSNAHGAPNKRKWTKS